MSKRNRSSRRTPGRSSSRPVRPVRPAPRPTSSAPSLSQSAASTFAGAVNPRPETDLAAEASSTTEPEPTRAARRSHARPSGLLAKRAEDEYVYVAQDIRHIGLVLAVVVVIFIVLWVLIEVAHVIRY